MIGHLTRPRGPPLLWVRNILRLKEVPNPEIFYEAARPPTDNKNAVTTSLSFSLSVIQSPWAGEVCDIKGVVERPGGSAAQGRPTHCPQMSHRAVAAASQGMPSTGHCVNHPSLRDSCDWR